MSTQQAGVFILFDPQTGAIPALVSLPNFDLSWEKGALAWFAVARELFVWMVVAPPLPEDEEGAVVSVRD